jgi:hypothetical protein
MLPRAYPQGEFLSSRVEQEPSPCNRDTRARFDNTPLYDVNLSDVDLGATTRQGTLQDWQTGVAKTRRVHARKGVVTGLLCTFTLLVSVHIAAIFFDELDSIDNVAKTQRAQMWLDQICVPSKRLPPDAVVLCGDYKDWMSRSPAMNALRLSLHLHVDHMKTVWLVCTRWLFTWDPFYVFEAKQVINAVCTSFATAVPILMIFGLLYIALLFRGPISDFRCWMGLRGNHIHQPLEDRPVHSSARAAVPVYSHRHTPYLYNQKRHPTEPHQPKNTSIDHDYAHKYGSPRYPNNRYADTSAEVPTRSNRDSGGWLQLSHTERERLTTRVLQNMAATRTENTSATSNSDFGDIGL